MLFSLFSNLVEIFSFLNVFKYLTVRTGLSMFTSMVVVFLVGGPLINYFSTHQIHDPIREDGPSEHIVKKIGTPTMGGLMILLGIFSGVVLWGDFSNPYNWFLLYITGSFGLLGAYDDYQKIKKNNSNGISSKKKIIIQIILALCGIFILYFYIVIGSITFSLLGILVGIFCKKFDQMSAVNNFIIAPLSFLSGTFYSVSRLPEPFDTISTFNPVFWLMDGVRFSALGDAESNIFFGCLGIMFVNLFLFLIVWKWFSVGYFLKD